ncbi:RNA-directed DNA polymerase from mobile element jockey-like protein [Elysia marginata]|uniref:RNA-directed DNA polymerase from mobile element jockey-like protein n=1 Tax=Elysia marginata TaxID=1093978 RepID=A0AAV4JBY3_9GAST|nr:RNA-directed DNA polymerase from mobile element jockey-like protein [Elysia marginata]
MRYGSAQEDEAHSIGNLIWLMSYGALQPIVCCKSHATYGCYHVIRYRRRRERSLLSCSYNAHYHEKDDNSDEEEPETEVHKILNDKISKTEIENAMKMFKSGKACGPDGIPSEFYKSISHVPIFTDYLTALFDTIFESGTYPDEWTKFAIFPLHKKGDINNVNNYRGLSLLNVLGKIFSNVLNARLKAWCNSQNIIPEAQAGFRPSYSTIDNIYILQCMVQKYLGRPGGRFYTLYVDFYKAFDWVDRRIIMECFVK